MSAWQSPGDTAANRLARDPGNPLCASRAADAVDTVIAELEQPDRDMLDAGAAELQRAFGKGVPNATPVFWRQAAADVWTAMLRKAQRCEP